MCNPLYTLLHVCDWDRHCQSVGHRIATRCQSVPNILRQYLQPHMASWLRCSTPFSDFVCMHTRLASFKNADLLTLSLLRLHECSQVTRGAFQEVPGTSQDVSDQGLRECTRRDISESPETSKNFSHLGLQECSHVTRGDISATIYPRTSREGTMKGHSRIWFS